MAKNNFIDRLVLCVIAIPLVICTLIFFDYFNNIIANLIILLLSLLGSIEMSKMLFKKKSTISLLSPVLIVASFVDTVFFQKHNTAFLLTSLALLVFIAISEIFSKNGDEFENSISNIAKKIFICFYPNMLLSFAPHILNDFNKGNIFFLFMLLLIFANDSFCYIGGKLFGKGNKGIIKASPNKSIAGFVSGYLFTIIFTFCFIKAFKISNIFTSTTVVVLFSIILSTLANIGDIFESIIKRSSNIKDSGRVMLGRGGVLDSIDSISFAMPAFYIFLSICV